MTRLYYVYVAAAIPIEGGPDFERCVIGVSSNPERALKALQLGNPARIILYRMYPFRTREEALYEMEMAQVSHADCRLYANWFHTEPSFMCAFIEVRRDTGRQMRLGLGGGAA